MCVRACCVCIVWCVCVCEWVRHFPFQRNREKKREKKTVDWTVRGRGVGQTLEREFLTVDGANKAIFWPTHRPSWQSLCQLWVLRKGDLNFCVRSTPLRNSGRVDYCEIGPVLYSLPQSRPDLPTNCGEFWAGSIFITTFRQGFCLHAAWPSKLNGRTPNT